MSRNESPKRFSATTTSVKAIPGAIAIHGARIMKRRPAPLSMLPHVGTFSGNPLGRLTTLGVRKKW